MEIHIVGRLDKKIYGCITEDIVTDEVIITDERISHINKRHPGHFEAVKPYLKTAVEKPDYILEDKSQNTGLILKLIEVNGLRFQVVLRLHTSADWQGFKNSVISAWKISESRWSNYLRNKKILYKHE